MYFDKHCLEDVIHGTLLGDACIRVDRKKYYYYSLNAKDKNFLFWFKGIMERFDIPTYITVSNKQSKVFALGFYINARKSDYLLGLRNTWYTKIDDKTVKTFPNDLKLTPATLLFWYLGDGCLVRRKNDDNRIPTIVLATNCFSKEDIDFLIQKLKEINLNFYPIKYKSGFTGKECGYCLYSKTEDGTPYRFFKAIGLECPKEIADCSTGSKGIYREEKFFRNKWPTEEDWVKILSNVNEVGPILRETRLKLGLSQNQFGGKVGMRRENIRDVEMMKRHFLAKNFRKAVEALGLDAPIILERLAANGPPQTALSNL